MGVLTHSFFSLPIYKSEQGDYYSKSHKDLEIKKRDFGKKSGTTFENLNKGLQQNLEIQWSAPPWKFNDIVGYLNIGMDGGTCLTADIFLKRKLFPKKHYWRNGSYSTLQNQDILYCCEIQKIEVDINKNKSYLEAVKFLLDKSKKIVRKYYLWIPSYSFECFDFAKAYKELRKHKVSI